MYSRCYAHVQTVCCISKQRPHNVMVITDMLHVVFIVTRLLNTLKRNWKAEVSEKILYPEASNCTSHLNLSMNKNVFKLQSWVFASCCVCEIRWWGDLSVYVTSLTYSQVQGFRLTQHWFFVQHTEIYYHQKEITELQCKYIFQQNLSQTEHNTKIRINPHKNSQHFRGSKTHRKTNKNTKNKKWNQIPIQEETTFKQRIIQSTYPKRKRMGKHLEHNHKWNHKHNKWNNETWIHKNNEKNTVALDGNPEPDLVHATGFKQQTLRSVKYVNFSILRYYYMFRSYDHLQTENV
jgi:hypothetical protein